MTLHPRPASPDWPNNVETDHPHEGPHHTVQLSREIRLRVQRAGAKANSPKPHPTQSPCCLPHVRSPRTVEPFGAPLRGAPGARV